MAKKAPVAVKNRNNKKPIVKLDNPCVPNPTTSHDRDYAEDELEFILAMEQYIKTSRRKFPTWSEALHVLKTIGYVKCVTIT